MSFELFELHKGYLIGGEEVGTRGRREGQEKRVNKRKRYWIIVSGR